MATMNKIMTGVLSVVGGVIGLVIVSEVISDNSDTGEVFDPEGEYTLAATVLNYLVPLLALSLIAGAVTLWRFG